MLECSDVLEENGGAQKQQMKEQPTAAWKGAEWQWAKASQEMEGTLRRNRGFLTLSSENPRPVITWVLVLLSYGFSESIMLN